MCLYFAFVLYFNQCADLIVYYVLLLSQKKLVVMLTVKSIVVYERDSL